MTTTAHCARSAKLLKLSRFFLVIPFVAIFNTACGGNCLNVKEVENLLNSELQLGDTRNKVESVLDANGITFSYDHFQNRYQATLINQQCSSYRAISVYITLNDIMRLAEIRVFESFTMP